MVEGKETKLSNILQKVKVKEGSQIKGEGWFRDSAQNENESKPPGVGLKLLRSNSEEVKGEIGERVKGKPNPHF